MKRTLTALLLSSMALAADPALADPGSFTGKEIVGDACISVLYSYVGSAQPQLGGDIFLISGFIAATGGDGPPPTPRQRWSVAGGFTAIGAYDTHAGQHDVPQGRIFFTNLLMFGAVFALAGPEHTDQSVPRSGFYLAPLLRERGVELGYHWSF